MRPVVVFLALFLSSMLATHCAADKDRLHDSSAQFTQWLSSLQFIRSSLPSFGGIRVHQTSAAVGTDGKPYYRVSPYIGNLAVLGLLRSRNAGVLPIAERWIGWFFAHLDATSAPDGVPFEHFYLQDGSGETTCVKPGDPRLCRYNDATDSAAATFFSVLWAYKEARDRAGTIDRNAIARPAMFTMNGESEKIERLASTLLALQNPDGLFWAKRDYHAKYLEDNCEVYAGLEALAHLERTVYRDRVAHTARYSEAAERLRRAILGELYDAAHHRYYVAKFEDGTHKTADFNVWYPDMQAQFWPVLFGVVPGSDTKSKAILAALNSTWNGTMHPDWAAEPDKVNGGWISADVACAALLAGEKRRMPIYLSAVHRLKTSPPGAFGWPFTAADAGWLVAIQANGSRN